MTRQGRTACIGLGSNLDQPTRNLDEAIRRIGEIESIDIKAVSSFYRSAPLGGMNQPDYINAVMAVETPEEPEDLLGKLQGIETEMGRAGIRERWAARIIDLDLLLVDTLRFSSKTLTIPHPGIALRNFVLLPLQEICPLIEIPGLGRAIDLPVNLQEPRIQRCDNDDH